MRQCGCWLDHFVWCSAVSLGYTRTIAATKYYYANDQLIAFQRSSGFGADAGYGRRYVFRDHLGSTSTIINGGGDELWTDYYLPFGDVRYTYHRDNDPNFPVQTAYRYTGQRLDAGVGASAVDGLDRGLYFYNSRYYDPTLGRFISPDTIVPEPGNPQALNRYSYVLNNPLRYTDPSGYAPQYPGDPDPNKAACSTQWCWENRWYMARGYGWDGSSWGKLAGPVFYDQKVLTEMAADAGISFVGSWKFNDQMRAVGTGIALFGRKLAQGLGQLKTLLGGGARIQHGSCITSSCALPPGTQTVRLSQETLSSGAAWIAQTTVHELAHVIDWHSRIQTGSVRTGIANQISIPQYGRFSDAWHGAPVTDYAAGSEFRPYPRQWERWAEAVTAWVFGSNTIGSKHVPDLSVQMDRISALLNGWY